MAEIELHPGTPYCDVATINRVARQQGLCMAMAQACVYDEICQVIPVSDAECEALVNAYLQRQDITPDDAGAREAFLQAKGWSSDDLRYFASKWERIDRFQQQIFAGEVERHFLSRKLAHDQVTFSLIRVRDGDLAFELHQRLLEEEDSFAALASRFSEGAERESDGLCGPVPFDQAHETVVEKLRGCREGELLEPFFLVDIWLILRLEHWEGSRLDDTMRSNLIDELFEQWMERRVGQLLAGQTPDPLPLHLLERV